MTSQGTPTIEEALKFAEDAIERGDLHVAKKALIWVLKRDPRHIRALLMFATITEDQEIKIKCYSTVIAVDPGNDVAKSALAQFGQEPSPPSSSDGQIHLNPQQAGPPITEFEVIAPIDESADPVLAKLDLARRDLLDMGFRNKLLNYRPLRSKGVEITDEKPVEIYRILVNEGRSMSFLPIPEKEDVEADTDLEEGESEDFLAQPEDADDADPGRYTDDKLQTPYTSPVLQRRLLNSYYAAKTYIEEQGVNILFIAVGMLEWYEAEASSELRKAPLVLVPVELSRSSVKAKFRVRYTEDEIVENLSLRSRLVGDFGITMPNFPENDFDLALYLQEVSKSISAYERWEIDADALALGFFSYGKFLMFNDLQQNVWPEDMQPHENFLIRRLLQDGFEDDLDYLDDDFEIDEIILPEDIHHVVDADSSQVLAIHDVNRGRNLVIQGPPGTGKSQTITNLIAEAIGHGKTVLFVSEKMAALEVVKRRLDQVGLGDACLELHSQKTKKKSVLEELRRSLALGKPVQSGVPDIAELKKNQARLNGYSKAVNEEIGESKLTPYEVFGHLLQVMETLNGKDLPSLELAGIEHWSAEKFRKVISLNEEIQLFVQKIGRPIDHPFWGSNLSIFLPADKEIIDTNLTQALHALAKLHEESEKTSQFMFLPTPKSRAEVEQLIKKAEFFSSMPDLGGVSVKADGWISDADRIRELLESGIRLQVIRQQFDPIVLDQAWDAEVLELRAQITNYASRFWRALSPAYREAKRQVGVLVRGEVPRSIHQQLNLLDAILERKKLLPIIEEYLEEGRNLFGERWAGNKSDWEKLTGIANWLKNIHERVTSKNLDPSTLEFIATNPDTQFLAIQIETLLILFKEHESSIRSVLLSIKLDEAEKFGIGISLIDKGFSEQESILNSWKTNIDRLQEIIVLKDFAPQFEELNIGNVYKVALKWQEARHHLTDLLQNTWLGKLLERAMQERSILAKFDGEMHENFIRKFCELDIKLLSHNRIRLANEHWKLIPKHQAGGQLGVLQREFAKKRRHMPIRKLISEAGKVIQVIKPVFMMSPLSIAQFLPPGIIAFDLVIFDEASQVKPVDAFGAILRGNQIVIVGDDRQLPPTTFFETTIDVDEDYSESITVDLESILGLCAAQGIPSRMLRWHYRSQHESLIAVSNFEFYDHKLVIFPSPDKDKQEVGLVYNYLPETKYDRGGSRKNIGEAKEVASAVMQHAKTSPNLTLGVATFSQSQQEAILDEIEILRRQDSSNEDFFHAHPAEPFFVKNLENVQGDERDVIFISIGYGRTADGRVWMNFGPINKDGGERRLNVLITRAKKRCVVFTNLKPVDIDLGRSQARGVQVLKRFLTYAESGVLDLPIASGREADSPFEDAVASELRKKGHRVERQIGSGGFFIDLAIVDSEHPGRYLLGIECDGATYHSARSARDRDRIRQEVLENLGWQIHRIWSTDWFRNPQKEIRRVEKSIQDAREALNNRDSENGRKRKVRFEQVVQIERVESAANENSALQSQEYTIARLNNAGYKDHIHEVPRTRMAAWIRDVVSVEGPVHVDEVARRIVNSAGLKRIGRRIQLNFDIGLKNAVRASWVVRRGDFLWAPEMKIPNIRSRASLPSNYRKMEYVAPGEIALAITQVVKASFGIEKDAIPQEVCKLFGFQRTTEGMSDIVTYIIEEMLESNNLIRQADYLALPD